MYSQFVVSKQANVILAHSLPGKREIIVYQLLTVVDDL